ncbi:MAG: thymidine kinase [Clostridiales bacterium]|nr:thymidine kinase [Clostridiales bacterium]
MAKLYFKYGSMGSSKTAQALITKFNYEERGMKVWLLKPAIDTRYGYNIIRSRIGIEARADIIEKEASILEAFVSERKDNCDVIIIDEAQFLSEKQVDELRDIVDEYDIPVLCFGLRTDFMTRLFPGSKRLMELAESITEIKTICECGVKATVNARIGPDGKVVTSGEQIMLGGNESYIAMCHKCWRERIKRERVGDINK